MSEALPGVANLDSELANPVLASPELPVEPPRHRLAWRRAWGAVGVAVLSSSLVLQTPGAENMPSNDNLVLTEQLLESQSPVDVIGLELSTLPDQGMATPAQHEHGKYLANKALADHYGLTVHSAEPYIDELEEDMLRVDGPQLPFETYFSEAQSFLKEYGVDLHLLENTEFHENDERRPTSEEVASCPSNDKPCARRDMIDLMEAVSGLPQEYVDLIDLNHIVYAIGDTKAAAYALAKSHTLHFEVGSLSESVALHEAGHLLADKEHAGGVDDRVLVTSTNGKKRYDHGVPYGAKNNPVYTYGAYEKAKNNLNHASNVAFESHHWEEACRIDREQEALGKKVRFSDNYGATSPGEHVAQLNANLTDVYEEELGGVGGNYFNRQTPLLFQEAVGNLARLYALNPKLAAYFVMRKSLNHRQLNLATGCKMLKLQKEGRLPARYLAHPLNG